MRPEQIALFKGFSMDSFPKQRADGHSVHSVDVLDDWIVAESSCDDTMGILNSACRDINAALEYKVMHPQRPLPDETQDVIGGVCYMFDMIDGES